MKDDCGFCKLVAGEMDVSFLYESDDIVAFRDINPKAPVHILVVPRKHIPKISDVKDADQLLLGRMLSIAKELAEKEGISDSGYRLIINCGENAGQEIFHLHLHLLGGRRLSWPPG